MATYRDEFHTAGVSLTLTRTTGCIGRFGGFDDTFAITDILMRDGHDLIHKAVGWMLRARWCGDQWGS